MPKKIEMPDIRRHWRKKEWLLIPGGWIALEPRVEAEASVQAAYIKYFKEDGKPLHVAERLAAEAVQSNYHTGFMQGLKASILGWAKEYATMFPEHRRSESTGLYKGGNVPKDHHNVETTLHGFKPEEMQGFYVPDQRPGRKGRVEAREALRQMGRRARQ